MTLQAPPTRLSRTPALAACRLCGFRQQWSNEEAAISARIWHMYSRHPAQWLRWLPNHYAPTMKRPVELGRLLSLPVPRRGE